MLILGIGRSVNEALSAYRILKKEGIEATVVNCRYVKPLDVELLVDLARDLPLIVTVEENMRQGGFGSAVWESLNDEGLNGIWVERIGIEDTFVEHGPPDLLRSKYGVDATAIVRAVQRLRGTSGKSGTVQLIRAVS